MHVEVLLWGVWHCQGKCRSDFVAAERLSQGVNDSAGNGIPSYITCIVYLYIPESASGTEGERLHKSLGNVVATLWDNPSRKYDVKIERREANCECKKKDGIKRATKKDLLGRNEYHLGSKY